MPIRSLDKDSLNQNLLLSLPFEEGTGTVRTQDVAKPHHPMTLGSAPAWIQLPSGIWALDFNGADPDYVTCSAAASADLDFTSGDFSGVVWTYADTFAGTNALFARRSFNIDGWMFAYNVSYGLYFATYQAAANQLSSFYLNPIGAWYLAGFSRKGASARLYLNGRDSSTAAVSHIDPATANRVLGIGVDTFLGGNAFDGKLWNPRIWGRKLEPWEHREIFHRERKYFGV